jgi:WXG100 family type VII secretion target
MTILRWNEKDPRQRSQKCFEYKEGEFLMADMVGASSGDMKEKEARFKACVEEFDRAANQIQIAVNNLANTWKGNGYQSFTNAMGKWNTDMHNVGQDLQSLSDAVRQADSGFQDLDAQISQSFAGYQ